MPSDVVPVDSVLLLLLTLYAVRGARLGLPWAAADFAGLGVSLLLALGWYRPVAAIAAEALALPPTVGRLSAFLLLWGITALAWGQLARRFLHSLRIGRGGPAGAALGILPGAAKGALLAVVWAALLLAIPIPDAAKAVVAQGGSGKLLLDASSPLRGEFSSIFGEAALAIIDELSIHSDGQTRMRLPFSTASASIDSEAEMRMLAMVNDERRRAGLPPLEIDATLRQIAREHSSEMVSAGYFAHRGEDGRSPSDRARAAGVQGATIGENIALAPNVEVAHRGLMESPSHRANILHPDYRRVGIGIVDAGLHGKMVTQDFAG